MAKVTVYRSKADNDYAVTFTVFGLNAIEVFSGARIDGIRIEANDLTDQQLIDHCNKYLTDGIPLTRLFSGDLSSGDDPAAIEMLASYEKIAEYDLTYTASDTELSELGDDAEVEIVPPAGRPPRTLH